MLNRSSGEAFLSACLRSARTCVSEAGEPLETAPSEGSGLRIELRHERNIRRANIKTHLRQKGSDLTSVVGLVIEHVHDKHPVGSCSRLAVDLAPVGERLGEPRRGKRLRPCKDALIEYRAFCPQELEGAEEVSPGLGHYAWIARKARQESKIAIGNVI